MVCGYPVLVIKKNNSSEVFMVLDKLTVTRDGSQVVFSSSEGGRLSFPLNGGYGSGWKYTLVGTYIMVNVYIDPSGNRLFLAVRDRTHGGNFVNHCDYEVTNVNSFRNSLDQIINS